MVERRVVQPAGLQLSNLAQPHIIEIAKSPSGQPAIVGLDDGQGNGPDLSAVVQESARPALLLGDQSAADPFFDFSGKPISHLSVAFGGGRPRGSERAGSHAGEAAFPTTTQDGTISFTSPRARLPAQAGAGAARRSAPRALKAREIGQKRPESSGAEPS
jgi:hypothetical protein